MCGRRDVNVFLGGMKGGEMRVGGGKEMRWSGREGKKIPRRNPGKGPPPLRVFK